ncbi:GDP-L-fucose synthase [Candidatus Brocadia sinica JPN1]|uniref:GDP-L-fucose synthase n=2 Tax=Candidatus Brocadiaceae TaxID=1127830 RepID=A0ABQ0JS24_9BACT|nr:MULTISPECIES: GDP-L-fucose synthase [Brocadia]GAN31540.1 GDP-L-fucose synthase [Candidatus Brocadia sinica JPN1]GIK12373.1 MAG: GDP-L-fucose synthase [Candidatus Brocadia sinica]GJQ17818.1 MAG: GDP-L-fucose synthase [Candidatus Brocadia sinica]
MTINNPIAMNQSSKIYVAGHKGLAGSAIVRKLQDLGYTNIIVRTHKELDLTRQSEVEAFFEGEKPEFVFLAAAKVGGILANNTYKAEFIYQNTMIAANVIHASYAYDVKKLLNLGSSCIYPKFAPQPLKEDHLLTGSLEPTNEPYAIAKISAIKLCRYYNEQYGTNFISVMPANLYGLDDNFDLETSHVLPALIRKMHLGKCLQNGDFVSVRKDLKKYPIHDHNENHVKDEEIVNLLSKFGIKSNYPINMKHETRNSHFTTLVEVWGSGAPSREFLHANDLADACIFLMRNYNAPDIGEFINIGTGKELKIKELAEIIKEIVGFKGEIHWDTSKPDGTPRKLLCVEKINRLGWEAKIDFTDGLKVVYNNYVLKNSKKGSAISKSCDLKTFFNKRFLTK